VGLFKKKAIPAASRRALAERHGCGPNQRGAVARCELCGAAGQISRFGAWTHFAGLEIDHVRPESMGGASDPDNLALLCRRCNRSKGHRYDAIVRLWEGARRGADSVN
jgi:5-methylcytosine-specific restriction endonuclease McrA